MTVFDAATWNINDATTAPDGSTTTHLRLAGRPHELIKIDGQWRALEEAAASASSQVTQDAQIAAITVEVDQVKSAYPATAVALSEARADGRMTPANLVAIKAEINARLTASPKAVLTATYASPNLSIVDDYNVTPTPIAMDSTVVVTTEVIDGTTNPDGSNFDLKQYHPTDRTFKVEGSAFLINGPPSGAAFVGMTGVVRYYKTNIGATVTVEIHESAFVPSVNNTTWVTTTVDGGTSWQPWDINESTYRGLMDTEVNLKLLPGAYQVPGNTYYLEDQKQLVVWRTDVAGEIQADVGNTEGSWHYVNKIVVEPANYVVGFGVPATLDPAKAGIYYEQLDAAEGANNVWGPTDATGAFPAQADNRSADIAVLADVTATAGVEFTEPRRMSLAQIDQRILLNGDEVDLTGQTNQPLQTRKLHVVDNTTTLDLAAGAVGDRAWTWNTQTEQLDFYRHNGASYIPDAVAADGLRGAPVADQAALAALIAKNYERRKRLDDQSEWVFETGRTPTATDVADDGATGAWVLQTLFPGQNVAPTVMVGNRWVWNRSDAIPDHLLPLNGQVIPTADVDFPELWSVRGSTTLIASFDDTAKTLTLKDYNGQGRFARAGVTSGVEQSDATAVNGLRTLRSYVQSDWNGQSNNEFSKGSGSLTGAVNNSVGMSSSDTETRPINVSEVWCIIAKPWVVSGDVTINQNGGDHTSRTAGDGSAGTVDTHTIWADAGETLALGTFTVLNGATGAIGPIGPIGLTGTSVDHISRTTGDGSPGTTDTYTVWADAGETQALGTYDVTIPGTTAIITPRQLVVTSPTATPDITIFEEQPNRYVVNVTTGKRLVLGAVADATVELVSAKYGTIVAQATGPSPTVTFTEEDVPAVPDKVGNREVWNRTDAIPSNWLELNGQVVAAADVAYPELWTIRSLSTLIQSFDDTAKTITLKNYNGQGRFARAGNTAGTEQSDATAVNGLRTLRTYLQSNWNGQSNNEYAKGSGSLTGSVNNSVGMSSSDPETRPINFSEIWCVVAEA